MVLVESIFYVDQVVDCNAALKYADETQPLHVYPEYKLIWHKRPGDIVTFCVVL